MTKPSPKRRIKSAKISLISLVPAGANQVRSLFKSRTSEEQDVIEMAAVAKIDVQGYLTALVYSPDMVDSQGDAADAQVVKQMAHDFIANMEGNGIDMLHDCRPLGNDRARLCETFLVQKGDPRFEGISDTDGNAIDPTGSWGVVIKIDDPDLRSRYAAGEWVGVSMFGSAIVEPLSKSQPDTKESTMDEKQMAELLSKFGAQISETIVQGLTKALAPKKDEQAPAPDVAKSAVEFEGDINSPEDIAKHAEKVLFASLDMSKPVDIAKWQAHLAKRAENTPANPNQERIDALQKELAKLSKAPAAAGEPSPQVGNLSVSDKLAKGRERAERLKKSGIIQ